MSFDWLAPLCFVAFFVCAITTLVLQFMIVQAINDKCDEDKTISGLGYFFGGLIGLIRTECLYDDHYPSGKLVLLCWTIRVLAIVCLIAGAYFYGYPVGQPAQ
jgi:hypothetical protein